MLYVRPLMTVIATLMITAVGLTSCDRDDDVLLAQGANATDMEFVKMASMANYTEIQAGKDAGMRADNPGVRGFGNMMAAHHTDANDRLSGLAARIFMANSDSMDAAHMHLRDTLATLSGRVYDSIYINAQVMDHQAAINLFNNEVQNGQNKSLKLFANMLLPTLQMHLKSADSLAAMFE